MSQGGFHALIEAQGEATATLHDNAANAARQTRRNSIFLIVIAVLLLAVIAQNYAAEKAKNKRDSYKEQAKAWKAIAMDDPSPLVRLQNAGFKVGKIFLISDGQQISILNAATKHNASKVAAWCFQNCGCSNDSDI